MKYVQEITYTHQKGCKIKNFLPFLSVSLLFSIIAIIGSSAQAVVIGQDQRITKQNHYYPSSAITKFVFIKKGASQFCTAPLIASNIAVTSAHCIKGASQLKLRAQGRDIKINRTWVSNKHDFGFLFLSDDIGQDLGWFDLHSYNHSKLSAQSIFELEGYSRDKKFYGQKTKCSSKQFDGENKVFTHDCDTKPGSSGAPLFFHNKGNASIAGINSGSTAKGSCHRFNSSVCSNLGVSASVIKLALEKL